MDNDIDEAMEAIGKERVAVAKRLYDVVAWAAEEGIAPAVVFCEADLICRAIENSLYLLCENDEERTRLRTQLEIIRMANQAKADKLAEAYR